MTIKNKAIPRTPFIKRMRFYFAAIGKLWSEINNANKG